MRGMNGMNMQQMMKQAQKMQKQMMAEQQDLAQQEFTGKAPDDMVTVKMNGEKKLLDLQIKKEAVDPDDIDMLTDLILTAVNVGMKQVDDATKQKMGKYTKGLGI